MPIIVENNASNADLYLSVSGAGSLIVPSLEELRRVLGDVTEEHAVVLGPGVDLGGAVSLADSLRVTRPGISVILIRRRVDTSVLAEALRSGMREVVEERDLTGLGEAVKRAHQVYVAVTGSATTDASASSGRLVTVFSPKGGVGKTTIASNLAVALAARDKMRVCLVDLDLAFGDVAITLQLFPTRTFVDTVALESELDFSVLEPLLTPHPRGFSTLVAPVEPDAKDFISTALLARILSILKSNFNYVIVDTAPGFDEHVLQAFDDTDELLLVTTLDVPTLKNVKIACETLDLLNFPRPRRHLVLNRADDKVGLSAEKVERTLDMKVAVAIPTSSEVANATNAGEPIVASHPKHSVSQAVNRLADLVTGAAGIGPAVDVDGSGGKKQTVATQRRGLLRRQGR